MQMYAPSFGGAVTNFREKVLVLLRTLSNEDGDSDGKEQ